MSKKALYSIIAILIAIVAYLLFVPTPAPVAEAPGNIEPTPEPKVETKAASTDIGTETTESVETITIEGLFLSLEEAGTDFRKSFYYLLLDDGTEIVRIDLRPLLGYSVVDPIGKLGVDRGQQVRITGTTEGGAFTIATITSLP